MKAEDKNSIWELKYVGIYKVPMFEHKLETAWASTNNIKGKIITKENKKHSGA